MIVHISRFAATLRRSALWLCASGAIALCGSTVQADSGTLYLVAPPRADILAMTPVFTTVQTTTDPDYCPIPRAGDTTPADGKPACRHTVRTGVDFSLGGEVQQYDLSAAYALLPELNFVVHLPLRSVNHGAPDGSETTDTGIADMHASLAYVHELGERSELQHIFTAKLPTGDAEKGLGTASYDYSYSQKLHTWYDQYRLTFMAGITIPTPTASAMIRESVVQYGPTIAYMAAVERSYLKPNLWVGLRAAGIHAFNSRVGGVHQPNSLTTLDIAPHVRYLLSDNISMRLGLSIPVITAYDLPGASSGRDPFLNLGVSMTF